MSIQYATKCLLTTLAAAFTAIALIGCHTIEGAGRDIEAVGGATAETADDVRPYDREGRLRQ